jgi:hypothetical protein
MQNTISGLREEMIRIATYGTVGEMPKREDLLQEMPEFQDLPLYKQDS